MKFRLMSTAFIVRDDKILMMKKSQSRLIDHEFWSGVGGHVEPEEMCSPRNACFREIYEETGLQETDIQELTLRYVLLRVKEGEIRQQFVYFGRTTTEDIIESDEGKLYWMNRDEIHNLHMSKIIRFMLEHYFTLPEFNELRVGTITKDRVGEVIIQWAELNDPEVF